MEASEIAEKNDEDNPCIINYEAQKEKIRRILAHQKHLYFSSSSSSTLASSSSFSLSSRKRNSLIDLMKGGNTSLRRLLDMEHTSLSTYFENYSGSPVIKTIPLWWSDTDEGNHDPWDEIKKFENSKHSKNGRIGSVTEFASGGSLTNTESSAYETKKKTKNNKPQKLTRKKSFKRLPGFGFWRFRGFRIRSKLKRLRIIICGRIL